VAGWDHARTQAAQAGFVAPQAFPGV